MSPDCTEHFSISADLWDLHRNRPYGNGAVTSAAGQLYFTVLGDGDGTTGVVETGFGIERKSDIYNLQGQKVTEIASGEIYIMDGRKFVAE